MSSKDDEAMKEPLVAQVKKQAWGVPWSAMWDRSTWHKCVTERNLKINTRLWTLMLKVNSVLPEWVTWARTPEYIPIISKPKIWQWEQIMICAVVPSLIWKWACSARNEHATFNPCLTCIMHALRQYSALSARMPSYSRFCHLSTSMSLDNICDRLRIAAKPLTWTSDLSTHHLLPTHTVPPPPKYTTLRHSW